MHRVAGLVLLLVLLCGLVVALVWMEDKVPGFFTVLGIIAGVLWLASRLPS